MSQLINLINRVLFVAAFAMAALAVWERLVSLFGFTTGIRGFYEPGRLLELSAIALLFVIALLLRDIRHALVRKGGT